MNIQKINQMFKKSEDFLNIQIDSILSRIKNFGSTRENSSRTTNNSIDLRDSNSTNHIPSIDVPTSSTAKTQSVTPDEKLKKLGLSIEIYSAHGNSPSLELVEKVLSKDGVFGKQWPQYLESEVPSGPNGWHEYLSNKDVKPPRFLLLLTDQQKNIIGVQFGFLLPKSNMGFSVYKVLDSDKRGKGIGKLMTESSHIKITELFNAQFGREIKGLIGERYKSSVAGSEYFDTTRLGAKVVPIEYVQPELYGQDYLSQASSEELESIAKDRVGFDLVCYEFPKNEGLSTDSNQLKSALREFFESYSFSNPAEGEGKEIFDKMAKQLDLLKTDITVDALHRHDV